MLAGLPRPSARPLGQLRQRATERGLRSASAKSPTHYTGRDSDSREADLADALDQLMRRARNRTATATAQEQRLLTRATSTPAPHQAQDDSLDGFDDTPDADTINDDNRADPGPHTGYGLYDAAAEALKW